MPGEPLSLPAFSTKKTLKVVFVKCKKIVYTFLIDWLRRMAHSHQTKGEYCI